MAAECGVIANTEWTVSIIGYSICDQILENLPFGHKLTFWENSNENFNNIFKINFFAHLDKATIKPSCCEVSQP